MRHAVRHPADPTGAHLARAAFEWACVLDVQARKPGNVSVHSAGHGMQAALFLDSARAAAAPLCLAGSPVGERIEAAVRVSLAAAGCNTNLGIVLLCAPLAAACERWQPARGAAGLRVAVGEVLRALDLDDARAAFRAIALANPGGLGAAAQQDVARPPTVTLGEAMALAADRDRIARQYADGYADLFELGLPAFQAGLGAARSAQLAPEAAARRAMQHVYLECLAAWPDSHIVRKHGLQVAHSVMHEAEAWRSRARSGQPLEADAAFAHWDDSLKARGLNPGTTADLSVAAAMMGALCDPSATTGVVA